MVKRLMAALLCASVCAGALAANLAPTVSLTGPAANAAFIGPATVLLSATAADSDGTISKVVFYKGATLLATVTAAPYTYNWTNVAAGSYSITAKATDNAAAVTTSAPLTVNVAANVLPTVSIINSPANATLIGPATVALSASAADSDGSITKVQYYNGATSIGSSTSAPYAINWSNVAAGTYSVTAKATDDKGGVSTSAATTIVVNVNLLPTVAIDAPLDNSIAVAPATIALRASAADSDGSIAKVQYFNGATSIGTATAAPYAVNWSNVAAGSYSVTAKATDNKGGITTSAPVRLVVNPNVPATVNITSPLTGANYAAPGSIALAAAASDADGSVTKVNFYNGSVVIATLTTAPYAFVWNNVAIGTYTLTAKATDSKGAVTTSDPVTVTVRANVAPTVSVTAPAANAVFAAPATMTLAASAADSDGRVVKVAFYNGSTLVGTATTAPFSVSWANVGIGNYSVKAIATDDKGLTATSVVVPVSVKMNALPTVSITAPAPNASFGGPATVTLSAVAADTDGSIGKVDFYSGAVLVGTATAAPYSINWANVAIGDYSISARATDDKGGVSTSSAVAMSVKANVAPVIAITAPVDNASIAGPAALTISANASDADGNVSKVEFFNGTTVIGSATTAPYAVSWNNVPPGAYAITAKATDNLGLVTVSAAVRVNVTGNAAQVYFVYTDQINTPREIISAAGDKVWQADPEPFGANPPNENPAGRGTFTFNQRFPGQYFDRETGLNYNYYRDYDPQTGRYVESDPIGLKGGINTYGYVGGDTLSLVDPFGLADRTPDFSMTGADNPVRQIWDAAAALPSPLPNTRLPDFVNFQVDLYVASVWGTFSRSGNSFAGGGLNRNFPSSVNLGGSVTAGYLNRCEVTGTQVDNWIEGYSGGATGAYYGLGGGVFYSPGNGTATVFGLGAGEQLGSSARGGAFVGGGKTFKQGRVGNGW